jgi:hypothetical protein
MAAYKMAAVKVTPPNDFPLGLIRSHMVVIHLFLMLCDIQRVVRDLCPNMYIKVTISFLQNLMQKNIVKAVSVCKDSFQTTKKERKIKFQNR